MIKIRLLPQYLVKIIPGTILAVSENFIYFASVV